MVWRNQLNYSWGVHKGHRVGRNYFWSMTRLFAESEALGPYNMPKKFFCICNSFTCFFANLKTTNLLSLFVQSSCTIQKWAFSKSIFTTLQNSTDIMPIFLNTQTCSLSEYMGLVWSDGSNFNENEKTESICE